MRRRAGPEAVPMGGLLFVYDLLATALGIVLSLMLRFETLDLTEAVLPYLPAALIPLLVRPPVRIAFGLYRREWRYASTRELRDLAASAVAGSMLIVATFGVATALGVPGTSPFPRSFFLVEPLVTLSLVGGVRFAFRMRLERMGTQTRHRNPTPTLIYGAGDAGAGIARSSAVDSLMGIRVVGFIDDDPRKVGSRLLGQRVFGTLDELPQIVDRTGARQLLVAMPSQSGDPIRRAVAAGQELGLEVKTIPAIRDLITGEFQPARPRQIRVDDLLHREPIELDPAAIAKYLNGASVLITGGGGSIGGELVRQTLRVGPRLLTVVDYHEAALWHVERDAAVVARDSGVRLNPILGDVRSVTAMKQIISRAMPDVVFHAAALKHVPYVEMYPSEGVLTNVIGTRNVLGACEDIGVPRFVLISTDKAVEPISVMGSTKRLAELLTLEAAMRTGKAYSAVRFGHVLGSSGSLVPLLQRQLEDGLPLTITDPDATRYFMTLSEAVTLILQAGAAAAAGEIYVLDMGAPVRIGDLVSDLVHLHGLDRAAVETRVTGLRPGEKLHEKLYFDTETPEPTSHPGISRARWNRAIRQPIWTANESLALERAALGGDDVAVRRILGEAMPVIETANVPLG